jgi:hypothetical protein
MEPVTAIRTREHYPPVRLPPYRTRPYGAEMALDPDRSQVPPAGAAPRRPEDAESLAELVADGTLVGATLPDAARRLVIPDQAARMVEDLSAYGA